MPSERTWKERVQDYPATLASAAGVVVSLAAAVGAWWAFAAHFQSSDDADVHERSDRIARLYQQQRGLIVELRVIRNEARGCRRWKLDEDTCRDLDEEYAQKAQKLADVARQIATMQQGK